MITIHDSACDAISQHSELILTTDTVYEVVDLLIRFWRLEVKCRGHSINLTYLSAYCILQTDSC